MSEQERPVFSVEQLTQSTRGNMQLAAKVLASFSQMMDRTRERLEPAVTDDNREQVAFAAHSLRSSSKSVGAVALADLLGRLEDEAQTLSRDELASLSSETLDMMDRVTQAVGDYLKTSEAA